MGVFFCKKVENGGGVLVKKWTFPQRRMHYVQYQVFFILHFTYLGGVRTQPTHPPAYGPEMPACSAGCRPSSVVRRLSISGNAWRASDVVIRGLASLVRLRLRVL